MCQPYIESAIALMCRLLMTSLKGKRLFIIQNHVHKIFDFGHIILKKKKIAISMYLFASCYSTLSDFC